jgi:hypothetical protein
VEAGLPTDKQDKQPRKEQIKVTDRRIFTPDGEIREEFRDEIHPSEPREATAAATTPAEALPEPSAAAQPAAAPPAAAHAADPSRRDAPASEPHTERRRSTMAERGENPNTPFANFIQQLIMQGYIALGLLRNPYSPETKIDVAAARDMIDILTLLQEKTVGNLTPDEEDFLAMHLGELKLAYVQRTKKI